MEQYTCMFFTLCESIIHILNMYFCKWIIATHQEYKWIAVINTFLNDLIAAIIILNLFSQLQRLKDVLNCMNDKYFHSADFYGQRFYTGCV